MNNEYLIRLKRVRVENNIKRKRKKTDHIHNIYMFNNGVFAYSYESVTVCGSFSKCVWKTYQYIGWIIKKTKQCNNKKANNRIV